MKAWLNHETRKVAWRPGRADVTIHHNGRFWLGSRPPNQDQTTPRYWDLFGEYRDNGCLQIAVEINVPTESNQRRASGFYAREIETGNVYLMHDGGIGGGQKGIGKARFLWWSNAGLMPVIDAHGNKRLGIVVAPIDASTTAPNISRFVQKVIHFNHFKLAVKNGETDSTQAREEQRTFQDYYDEFTGKKRRCRVEEIEYISRHGDIVRALHDWRVAKSNEKVVKNAYIDLGTRTAGVLTEIYEVKTKCDRQTLYAAIGQIVVHDDSPISICQRYLVLPDDDQIPHDLTRALKRVVLLCFASRSRATRSVYWHHEELPIRNFTAVFVG